jgi:glycine/D-amino acid oxidase-like deaminating enzyme
MTRTAALDIDENRSLWIAGAPDYAPLPPLRGPAAADVAIIGGGFTGISTAYHLSRRFPEKRIVLLEARALANGASGRNGGQMLNWIAGAETGDPELTQLIFSTTKAGIDEIEQIIRENRLNVRYRREGCLQVFTNASRAEAGHAHVEELQRLGIPLRFLQGAELLQHLHAEGAKGAIFDASEGQINGVDLIRELRPVLLSRGVGIFENTPVTSVQEGSTITLTVPEGEVRAAAIVLATNAYTPRLGYFRNGIFPLHSHVIATEPLSAEERRAAGWGLGMGFSDDLDRISYAAVAPGGEIIFGGGSNASYAYLFGGRTQFPGPPERAQKGFQAVEKRLSDYFPAVAQRRITHRWTGPLGITMSRMCSMGVRGEHRNVYFALGYSGHGVTMANLAGRVLCDIYSGDDERWRRLPFYQKRLGGVPPEPLRWLGYHVYTRLTGRSPRKIDEIV